MNTFIIDFETTGLNPYHHDIIDIGCKLLNEDTTFQCLVRPKTNRLLSEFTTNLTGITNKMIVQHGKPYLSAYQDFINFILENSHNDNPIYLIAHNGDGFDFIYFRKIILELITNNLLSKDLIHSITIQYIDTIPFAKRLLENRHKYSLQTLCSTYHVEQIDAHRALPDVFALEKIYNILCNRLSDKDDLQKKPDVIHNYIYLQDY